MCAINELVSTSGGGEKKNGEKLRHKQHLHFIQFVGRLFKVSQSFLIRHSEL